VLGSPYGTTGPLSINPKTGRIYGPEFPQTCVRDDVRCVSILILGAWFLIFGSRLHKLLLDALGVQSIAAVIGGSMGGMATLEWPLCTPAGFIKNIIPISTSLHHDAWGIAWAEAQRQCVFADPGFESGYYTSQPTAGLAAARMVGMLTYRSSASFGRRFGREGALPRKGELVNGTRMNGHLHHERRDSGISTCDGTKVDTPKFKAQSYLHYQGQKFTNRFDANCFVHLTRKMDAHDITYHKNPPISPKALVIGISSDVLFRPEQQEEIARYLPESRLVMVESEEGHDGFLLEFEKLGRLIEAFLRETCSLVYEAPLEVGMEEMVGEVGDSVFGEVESGW
jgi:homoserine O-acetyltransferase